MSQVKKRKRRIVLILAFAFIVLVLFIVIYVIISYTGDQSKTKKKMEEVESLYEVYQQDLKSLEQVQESIYDTVLKEVTYQSLKEGDETAKSLFQDYLTKLDQLKKDAPSLEAKCMNVLYPEVEVNNKCEDFILSYEEATNTYITDVKRYNKYIEEYNKWLQSTSSSDPLLEKITLEMEYLDYNGDREYLGKEEIIDDVGELENEETNES